jgi:elongation factor Ts
MTITAAMVKALRERTGAGMMECKKALTGTGGDMEGAVEELRKKGAAKADQKSGRITAEGVIGVAISEDGDTGTLVEVNCETDFVAKDENFREFTVKVAKTALTQRPENVDALVRLELYDTGKTVEERRVELFSKVGENIGVRRFALVGPQPDQQVRAYIHGSRIGVLVRIQGGHSDLGRDIAMHIAASRPLCVSAEDVPAETLDKEREIFSAQAVNSGKPEHIAAKIVDGKLQKFLSEITLLGQPFVKDPEQSVEKILTSEGAKVLEFVRFEVGEGIERKEDDFVAEVMAQAKGT